MSFRLKPLYFERDGPVCTRSASSFCRNPLNFCTHVVWVNWWYHAKFQPFLSSGCSPFQFQGHLAENKSLNAWKYQMKSERVEISVCGFECCMLDAKKVLSWNNFRKMKCLWNRWVYVWNPRILKRDGSVCKRSASSFCRNPLNFCAHVMWVKWWYHAKFQPFLISGCSPFQFQGHLAENKSLNAWKIANEIRKGSNYSMWLLMVHIECTKSHIL